MGKFYCKKCGNSVTSAELPNECDICHADSTSLDEVYEYEEQIIPAYWKDMLEDKIAKIHELQEKAGPDGTSFGIITDIHWVANAKHSAALMEEVLTRCDIPYFFNSGDIVSGYGLCEANFLITELDEYRRAFSRIEDKCLIVEGNHDTAYSTLGGKNYYDENLTKDVFYEHYFRFETLYPNRVFGPEKVYYYADDATHKVRYIVLNTHDIPSEETDEMHRPLYNKFRMSAIRQEQLNWFAHIALDVPSKDWTVVMSTHEQPNNDAGFGYGRELVIGVLNAFRKHTAFEGKTAIGKPEYETEISVDFTDRGGNFAVWVCGHTHYDLIKKTSGIAYTSTLNDSLTSNENSIYKRKRGTTTEHAFDIFTINKKEQRIYITRIGAGADRELDYDVFE